MKSWLYPGAKIVCVDDTAKSYGRRQALYWNPVKAGTVYVISEVFTPRCDPDVLSVRLVGQSNPSIIDGYDCGYAANRFRPLHDCSKQVESLKQSMRDALKRVHGKSMLVEWR